MRPAKVHWSCYENCNCHCQFCYDKRGFVPDDGLGTADAKLLINEAKLVGAKWFVFGGGDPLMRSDLRDLIVFAKKIRLKVDLQTNGVILAKNPKLSRLILPLIDRLGLSLDSTNPRVHDAMRGRRGHFAEVVAVLNEAGHYDSFKTTVRTVMTSKNHNYIEHMAAFLSQYPTINKWSVREFVPVGLGEVNKEEFALAPGDFDRAKTAIEAVAGLPFKVAIASRDSLAGCHLLINCEGNIRSNNNNDNTSFWGNFKDVSLSDAMEKTSSQDTNIAGE